MSKEKNPKLKNVRVIHYLNYLIFLGTLTFFSASCAKEEKGDEINKNQQIEGQKTKRSSEAFIKNNERDQLTSNLFYRILVNYSDQN